MHFPQRYFANAVGAVDFVPADGYAHLHWSGTQLSGVEFRALHVHAHNLLLRFALPGLLADHRALPATLAPADHDWLLARWLPALLDETPVLRYAVLPALIPAHCPYPTAVRERVQALVSTAFFEALAPAVDWLRQAPVRM